MVRTCSCHSVCSKYFTINETSENDSLTKFKDVKDYLAYHFLYLFVYSLNGPDKWSCSTQVQA